LVLQITIKCFNFNTSNPIYCCSLFHCFLLPYLWFYKFVCPESWVCMYDFLHTYVRAFTYVCTGAYIRMYKRLRTDSEKGRCIILYNYI